MHMTPHVEYYKLYKVVSLFSYTFFVGSHDFVTNQPMVVLVVSKHFVWFWMIYLWHMLGCSTMKTPKWTLTASLFLFSHPLPWCCPGAKTIILLVVKGWGIESLNLDVEGHTTIYISLRAWSLVSWMINISSNISKQIFINSSLYYWDFSLVCSKHP